MTNNTFSMNTACYGGACFAESGSSVEIVNCIARNDSALYGDNEIDGAMPAVLYSNIQGGWPGEGNIDIDPLFRDIANGDFHLMSIGCGDSADSPCMDAGDPNLIDSLLDCSWGLGTARSDMGAYGGGDSTNVGFSEPPSQSPGPFSLSQSFPNPFNAQTTIQYSLASQSLVSIDIFDILGRKIETLAEGIKPAGNHQVTWDAGAQSSGIYFYRIQAGDMVETKKMLLMK